MFVCVCVGVCGCVYFREYTRLLPVGEYVCGYVEMFLYMHTACLGVFIQTCMCVYIYIYTQRWSVCVYIVRKERPCFGRAVLPVFRGLPISTPSPRHYQVTFGSEGTKVRRPVHARHVEPVPRSHCANLDEKYGLDKQSSYYGLYKMGSSPWSDSAARCRFSRNLLASTSRSRADKQEMG